jgi:hypothetical protein
MRKIVLAISLAALALPLLAQQQAPQLKLPRVSQKQSVTQTVGLTDITITYSRPGVKGRQIWGALVPYDQVWRTGANEATTIAFSDDVTINGQPLPKGTYSLHTIPGKDEWTIIFNKVANQWGSFTYDAAQDALRVKAKPHRDEFRESLSFDIPEVKPDSAIFAIHWENLAVPFTVNTATTQKVMANATAAVAGAKPDDWQTPFRAANFAYDSGDMDKAKMWLDQSLKVKETINNLWLKAQMQAKAGDKAAAVKTGEMAVSKAGANDKVFATEIQKTIDSWKSKPAS